jgi:hypothetical protein
MLIVAAVGRAPAAALIALYLKNRAAGRTD